MIESNSIKPNHLKQLLYLVALWLGGNILAAIASEVIVHFSFTPEEIKEAGDRFTLIFSLSPNLIKLFMVVGSTATFIIPVIAFYKITQASLNNELNYKHIPHLALIVIIVFILICSTPLIQFAQTINLKMQLPEFLSGIEEWMFSIEDQANSMLVKLLTMYTTQDLIFNFIVIAVFPAVAEELFFRGIMQKLFSKMLNRPHLSILITAAIFSFIHFQFYGFLPRMLLGIIFGYIFYWTNSIWYPIFAHLLYNGSQVILAYKLGDKFINAEEPIKAMDPLIIIIGTILFFVFMIALHRLTIHVNKKLINDNG